MVSYKNIRFYIYKKSILCKLTSLFITFTIISLLMTSVLRFFSFYIKGSCIAVLLLLIVLN